MEESGTEMSCLTDPFRRFSPSGMVSRSRHIAVRCDPLCARSASSTHPASIASARTASISSSRSRWREEEANSTRTSPTGPTPRGRVGHCCGRERDGSGRHEFERGQQVCGFATHQREKLGERRAARELQPGSRAVDRQRRGTQHCAGDNAESPQTKHCLT